MSTPKAFSIITPDVNPDSMKIITEGNWNGEMVFCSRERYLTARNEPRYKQQLERPGVYILIGASDDSSFPKSTSARVIQSTHVCRSTTSKKTSGIP